MAEPTAETATETGNTVSLLSPSSARSAYSTLVRIAAEMLHGEAFISPYAEDNRPGTPNYILAKAERQQEALRLWAIAIRQSANEFTSAITAAEARAEAAEGCKLVAHDTGDGWALMVENSEGGVVAYLDWPKSWPEVMAPKELRQCGFEIV